MATDRAVVAGVASQIGATLLDDSGTWVNRFQIRSHSSNRFYVIAQRRTDDREWGCSCPGWRNRRRCKHVTDVLSRLSTVAASADFDAYTRELLASARTAFLDLSGPGTISAPRNTGGRSLDL